MLIFHYLVTQLFLSQQNVNENLTPKEMQNIIDLTLRGDLTLTMLTPKLQNIYDGRRG